VNPESIEKNDDAPEEWTYLTAGDAIYIIARGETAQEFRPLVDDFVSKMNAENGGEDIAPEHVEPVPVKIHEGVRDTQNR
jgi:hypothetical protein